MGPVTLGSYPNQTLAVVEVTGVLDQYYSNSPGWNFPPPTGDLRGTLAGQMDAGGQFNGSVYQCYANVAVLFSQGGGKSFCDYWNQKPITSDWADTSVLRGDGTARWYKGPASFLSHCDGAGKPPCYTYTGSFSVTVTPVAAELTFSASRYVVYPGKASVTFTAGRTPASFGRFSVPFTIQSWTWTPDGGSATTPCLASTNPCTYAPASSGTMQVTALVNGVTETKSVHVRKVCTPTGDPLLDSLPLIDALGEGWDSAGTNLPASQRREQAGALICFQGTTDCRIRLYNDASFGPCHSGLGVPGMFPGEVVVGDFHIHPFSHGDQLPANDPSCLTPSGSAGQYDAQIYGGPSRTDYAALHNEEQNGNRNNLPHYIMDADKIVRIAPGTDMTNFSGTLPGGGNRLTTTSRNGGTNCAIP